MRHELTRESVRAWRLAHGLRQQDVAAEIGVVARTYMNWEQGRTNNMRAERMEALRQFIESKEADSPHESPEDTPSYPTSVASRALLFRDHQKASTSSQPYIQAITSGTERRVWAVLQGEDLLRAVREAHKANMPETVSRLLELTEQLDSIQAQVAGLNEELEAFDLEFRGIMTTVRKAQERGHNGG